MLRVNKGVKALISQGFFQGSCVAVARAELGLGAPGAFEKKKYRCAVQGAKSLVPVSSPNVGSNARICLPVKA